MPPFSEVPLKFSSAPIVLTSANFTVKLLHDKFYLIFQNTALCGTLHKGVNSMLRCQRKKYKCECYEQQQRCTTSSIRKNYLIEAMELVKPIRYRLSIIAQRQLEGIVDKFVLIFAVTRSFSLAHKKRIRNLMRSKAQIVSLSQSEA